MALSRLARGRQAAIKAAHLSRLYSHRVGAALFKGNRLVSLGWNCKKTHPRCTTECSQHAEFNVFVGLRKKQIVGCDLYIARITRTEKVGIARPCRDCQTALAVLPLGKVFYTNLTGSLVRYRPPAIALIGEVYDRA